jgi:hypothetical protein
MKKLLLIFGLLTSLVTVGQKKGSLPNEFYTCWAASYEENKEESSEKIYRPCLNEFKPSRFRQNISFDKNGTCKVLMVGEADAHYHVNCKWTYDKKKKTVSIGDEKNKVKMKFKIVQVNKDILKIIFVE